MNKSESPIPFAERLFDAARKAAIREFADEFYGAMINEFDTDEWRADVEAAYIKLRAMT
jgi:hypothetical protein